MPVVSHELMQSQQTKPVWGYRVRWFVLVACPCAAALSLLFSDGCSSTPKRDTTQLTGAPAAPMPVQSDPPPTDSAAPSAPDIIKEAAAKAPALFEGAGWRDLFDGQSLTGWAETRFAGRGEIECRDGLILMKMGNPFTGLNWTNDFPKMNYEVALDAMRVMGSDFFCGLTVPVGDSFCSLIVGGWGGSLLGISSLDGLDASENETTKYRNFETRRWYRIRLRVTEKRIQAWIDSEKLVDVDTSDKRISLRPGDIEMSKPMGLACWETSALLREIKVRRVDGPAPRK